jgi:hypothetical protein
MGFEQQTPERASPCSDDEKRAALKVVLESQTFTRCDQLAKFLQYVTDMSISGRSREITEYLIAVEALGRPAGFSPADDSSVRSRAHELRRRLQKYYDSEAPAAPLRIELPKGSYVPKFVGAITPLASPEESLQPLPLPARVYTLIAWPRSAVLFAAICLALVAILAVLLLRAGPARRPNSIVQQAWGPLARPDTSVLICVASPLHLVVRPYMSVVAEGLPKYPAPDELYALHRQHRPLPPGTKLYMHPVDNSIQMGHMGALITLTGVLQSHGATFQVLPERSAPVSALRGRTAILIGDPQDSSATTEMLQKTPLTIDYDSTLDDLVIRDRRQHRDLAPKRGDDKRYTDVFGLITVMPAPGALADQRLVIVSGITSVGTQGAAEFFASPRELEALRRRFMSQGLPGFPAAYQVVVHCKSNDTLLVSAEYESHVVIQR